MGVLSAFGTYTSAGCCGLDNLISCHGAAVECPPSVSSRVLGAHGAWTPFALSHSRRSVCVSTFLVLPSVRVKSGVVYIVHIYNMVCVGSR